MVTPHFQSIKQTTNKQNFMFAHIKPKYSCPANYQKNAIQGREK